MTLNARIELALHNPHLQRALDANYTRSLEKRDLAMGALPNSALVRDRARALRLEALRNPTHRPPPAPNQRGAFQSAVN